MFLRIPKQPAFVLVSGQVYNTSAITFEPNPNGSVVPAPAPVGQLRLPTRATSSSFAQTETLSAAVQVSWLDHHVLETRLEPGDVVVVPQKIIGSSLFWAQSADSRAVQFIHRHYRGRGRFVMSALPGFSSNVARRAVEW